MTKCENCYHSDVCADYNKTHSIDWEPDCKYIKDKSLIVELPCKVGDTVYGILNNKIYSLIILNIAITENNIEFSCMETDEECIDTYGDVDFGVNFRFSLLDINKTVFTNREEAEKALNAENTV